MDKAAKAKKYWKRNIRILAILLSVWAFVSFGLSIIFADALDTIQFAGFKLGFWMAQQGSIFIFLILIAVYVYLMNKLDREFDVHD
jgi:putative solute:sodium symporter small subunit